VSNIVEEIKKPINEEMKLFEQKFYESMQSKVPLLDKVTRFIVTTKGKQMRPMFVFLTVSVTALIVVGAVLPFMFENVLSSLCLTAVLTIGVVPVVIDPGTAVDWL
jgi:predicted ATPase